MRPWFVEKLNLLFGTELFRYFVPNYLILLSIAGVAGTLVAVRRARRLGLDADVCYGLALWGLPSAVLVSRLFHVIQEPEFYGGSLLAMLDPLRGDAAAYGGFIGGAVAFFAYLKIRGLDVWRYLDCTIPGVGVGTFITRLGCFTDGCDFGAVTACPLAVTFPAGSPAHTAHVAAGLISPLAAESLPVHPVQLYLAAKGLGLALLAAWWSTRPRSAPGEAFCLYWVAYAIARFGFEYLRGDAARGFIGPFSTSQAVSIPVFVLAAAGLWARSRRRGLPDDRRGMDPRSFRFAPPPFRIPPPLQWCLARAFAGAGAREAAGTGVPAGSLPRDRLAWARTLGLSARIGGRIDKSTLAAELGDEVAAEFLRDHRDTAARSLLLHRQAEVLSAAAVAVEAPVVLLKGSALLEAGLIAPGLRDRVDVDALIPADRAEHLVRALEERGFRRSGLEVPSWHHHLPSLRHERLGSVELHLFLPGIGVEDAGPATANAFLRRGLTRALPGLDAVHVPARTVLAAHAMVHALVHHGTRTETHLLQAVGDLLDLAGGAAGVEQLVSGAREHVESLSKRETDAVASLCAVLARGDLPGAAREPDAARLLDHCLTGLQDPDYRGFLVVELFFRMLKSGDLRGIGRRIGRTLRSSRGEAAGGEAGGQGAGQAPPRMVSGLRRIGGYFRSWLAVRRRKM